MKDIFKTDRLKKTHNCSHAVVPNLRFIGFYDRDTLRWARLCLTTPIKLYRPDLSAKIAIDLLILLNTVIGGDPYSKEGAIGSFEGNACVSAQADMSNKIGTRSIAAGLKQ